MCQTANKNNKSVEWEGETQADLGDCWKLYTSNRIGRLKLSVNIDLLKTVEDLLQVY